MAFNAQMLKMTKTYDVRGYEMTQADLEIVNDMTYENNRSQKNYLTYEEQAWAN